MSQGVRWWRKRRDAASVVCLSNALALVLLFALEGDAWARQAAQPVVVGDVPVESTGGELQVRWNASLLETLGIRIASVSNRFGVTDEGFDRFELRPDSNLAILRHGRSLTGTTSGTLYVHGGYQLASGTLAISVEDALLTSAASVPRRFEIQTAGGEQLFYADNVMAESADSGHS